jgi:hypothetical protein
MIVAVLIEVLHAFDPQAIAVMIGGPTRACEWKAEAKMMILFGSTTCKAGMRLLS